MAKQEATLILKIKQIGASALGKTKELFTGLATAATAAGAAIVAFVGAGVAAYKEQESAVNRLNQALVNQGDYTRQASRDMQNFASNLQKTTTYGDETIINMLSLAKAFGVSNEEAQKMVQASTDLAAATGMSLESAVKNLGKTMAGMTGELGESVPALRDLTVEQLKAGNAIDLVAEKFKGAAEAQAQGLGSIDQLKNAWGDFMESIGKRVAPLFSTIAKSLTLMLQSDGDVNRFVDNLADGFGYLAKTGSWVVKRFQQIGGVIGTVMAASVEATSAALSGNFSQAKDIAKMGMSEVSNIIETAEKEHQARMAEIEAAVREGKAEQEIQDEEMLRQSLANKQRIRTEAKMKEITEEQKYQAWLLGIEFKAGTKRLQAQEQLDKAKEQARASSLARIATLQGSNNKLLATIGKAAALTQIAIDGPQAVTKALAAFPPPLNFAAATAVGAAVTAQAAQVMGVQLAEGGIVQASPGGTLATIGEGGRDEAVIPLDDAGPIGGNINIIVNGGLLGDESSARALATALDRELYNLRKDNQSVAFDSGLT